MRTHAFGRDGPSVGVIGQGTWQLERDRRRAVQALRCGVAGITYSSQARSIRHGQSDATSSMPATRRSRASAPITWTSICCTGCRRIPSRRRWKRWSRWSRPAGSAAGGSATSTRSGSSRRSRSPGPDASPATRCAPDRAGLPDAAAGYVHDSEGDTSCASEGERPCRGSAARRAGDREHRRRIPPGTAPRRRTDVVIIPGTRLARPVTFEAGRDLEWRGWTGIAASATS